MSRIGKVPVSIPGDVKIDLSANSLSVKGKLGLLSYNFSNDVTVAIDENKIFVKPANDSISAKAKWGLTRTLINNMVKGVTEGFVVDLEILGVGYRAAVDGKILTLFLGYSHEIKFAIPENIEIKCEKPTMISIFGIDKQKVGEVAAQLRKLRKPEPYKGKGIRYKGEKVPMKAGKKK
jgi:large subunit ribosomal protein L6